MQNLYRDANRASDPQIMGFRSIDRQAGSKPQLLSSDHCAQNHVFVIKKCRWLSPEAALRRAEELSDDVAAAIEGTL
jgi:hypothetical protein